MSGSNVVVANKTWQGFTGQVPPGRSRRAQRVPARPRLRRQRRRHLPHQRAPAPIRIENIRARNTGDGTIGSGHGNVIQFNNSWQTPATTASGVRRVNAYGGDTEDMISIFKSGGVDAAHPLVIEDVHIESPLSGPLAWSSGRAPASTSPTAGGHDIIAPQQHAA